MYAYTIWEWIGFFMVYCFAGWVWETLYVSAKTRKWTNRGFLNGPFLPIYGFGAITILFATLSVRQSIVLTFLFGMVAASALEYLTGYVMERLFHVRYWDYSNEFLNINGYVCLVCSIAWGVASVLLIRVLHKPVEMLILSISSKVLVLVDVVFLGYFVWDTIESAREAFDLKAIIDEQIRHNEKIQRLQSKLDELVAATEENRERVQEVFEENRERIFIKFEENREKLAEARAAILSEMERTRTEFDLKNAARRKRAVRILKRNLGAVSRKHKLDKESLRSLFQ
jgi:uncharacterized membrane protein